MIEQANGALPQARRVRPLMRGPAGPTGFGPVPLDTIPFPTIVVTSDEDPYLAVERAGGFAESFRALCGACITSKDHLRIAYLIDTAVCFDTWRKAQAGCMRYFGIL